MPPTHTSFVSGQTFPHVLQLRGSVSRFAHDVPQSVNGAMHWQVPPEHASFARTHAVPHAPQLSGSVVRSEHLGFELGHGVRLPHWQAPPLHVPAPQEMPHAPQFAGSLAYDAGSTQNVLHSSCPDGQPSSAVPHPEHLARKTAAANATRVRAWRGIMGRIIRPRRQTGRARCSGPHG